MKHESPYQKFDNCILHCFRPVFVMIEKHKHTEQLQSSKLLIQLHKISYKNL
jgi:hypothetical protein